MAGYNGVPLADTHPHVVWLGDPAVLAPIALLVGIYGWRFRRARVEAGGRGAGLLQVAAFAAGVLALLAAIASPVDALGEDYLFSAHMVQHLLLADLAAAFLLLSLSRVIMRPATRRLVAVERRLGRLAHPATGLVVWLAAIYVWHVPALYEAAIRHPGVHLLEHATFFAGGVAVWWPLIQPVPMRRRMTGMWPVGYIAAAKFGLAALGLYLTWSSNVIYHYYESTPRIWGLTPIEDQNVGGAIMMIEQSLVFVVALVVLFTRMLARSEEDQLREERLEEARDEGASESLTPQRV